jgi:membrane protein DedA with SNARE-associated domain
VPAWTDGAPFGVLFAFFFAVVLVRTQATYWLARLAATWSADEGRTGGAPAGRAGGGARLRPRWVLRAGGWLRRVSEGRGLRAVQRWGLLAVPASFLATGTKTAVNGAAGLLRMPFGRYTAAMLVGCALHATIYATVGWAAWTAAVSAATGSVWGAAALAGLALGVVVLVLRARARSRSGVR